MVVGLTGRPSLWYSGQVLEQDWDLWVLPLPLTLSTSPHMWNWEQITTSLCHVCSEDLAYVLEKS